MKTKASVASHPIHPMLIPLPVGLWIFSFFCDLMYLGERSATWSTMAYFTIVGGIVGGVVAALPGLLDLVNLPASRAKRLGIYHMSINLGLVTLYLLNFIWRSDGGATRTGPILLSVVGMLLLAASGWLGGEMVYVHGVAVDSERDG